MNKTYFFLLLFCFVSMFSKAQDIPTNASTIIVHNVSLKEVVNALLDSGYTIKKIDSNFNTVETDVKDIQKKPGYQQMILKVRVKDSTAYITGLFGFPDNSNGQYKSGSLGAMLAGVDLPIKNLKVWQGKKKPTAWSRMNDYAISLSKPIEYLVQ